LRLNPAGLGATLALHLMVVLGLLAYKPARKALFAAAPMMVDLILPPRAEPPKPLPPTEPPRAKPVVKRVQQLPEPLPMLTLPAEAPSPVIVPPPPPAPVQIAVPPAPPAPLTVTQPIFNADYLDNPAPPYPPQSRRAGEQGRVILRVLVNARGGADEVQLRASSGFARLDDSARATVLRWKFVPAKRSSEAVPAWVLIPISFRLEN
jgi:protein TonB